MQNAFVGCASEQWSEGPNQKASDEDSPISKPPQAASLSTKPRSSMKFTSVLATAALALVSLDRAASSSYSSCTWYDAVMIMAASNQILLDEDCVKSMDDRCPNAKCYATIAKVTKEEPDCTAGGSNPKDIFETLLAACKTQSLGGNSTSTSIRSAGVNSKSAPTDSQFSTSKTSTSIALTSIADAVAKAFP